LAFVAYACVDLLRKNRPVHTGPAKKKKKQNWLRIDESIICQTSTAVDTTRALTKRTTSEHLEKRSAERNVNSKF